MTGNEPVTTASAITTALVATVNVLALILDWDTTLVAGLNLAIGAWVIAVAFVVRGRVTPNDNVALTTAESKELTDAGFAPPPFPVEPT